MSFIVVNGPILPNSAALTWQYSSMGLYILFIAPLLFGMRALPTAVHGRLYMMGYHCPESRRALQSAEQTLMVFMIWQPIPEPYL